MCLNEFVKCTAELAQFINVIFKDIYSEVYLRGRQVSCPPPGNLSTDRSESCPPENSIGSSIKSYLIENLNYIQGVGVIS